MPRNEPRALLRGSESVAVGNARRRVKRSPIIARGRGFAEEEHAELWGMDRGKQCMEAGIRDEFVVIRADGSVLETSW